jgi:hypothetical protein
VIPAKRGKKTWCMHGVRAEMRRPFPKRLYGRRALVETLFSSVKRNLSARAPKPFTAYANPRGPPAGPGFQSLPVETSLWLLADVNKAGHLNNHAPLPDAARAWVSNNARESINLSYFAQHCLVIALLLFHAPLVG